MSLFLLRWVRLLGSINGLYRYQRRETTSMYMYIYSKYIMHTMYMYMYPHTVFVHYTCHVHVKGIKLMQKLLWLLKKVKKVTNSQTENQH